jgi:hypothetical protein
MPAVIPLAKSVFEFLTWRMLRRERDRDRDRERERERARVFSNLRSLVKFTSSIVNECKVFSRYYAKVRG